MASRLQTRDVDAGDIAEGSIRTSFYRTPGGGDASDPVLLLHGFDSSCLEWRRLVPLLEDQGVEVVAVDLLGWGFTSREGVRDFSAAAKCRHLAAFVEQEIGRRVTLVGTSLGAAFAVQLAAERPDEISRLCLVDPQVLVDGVGPVGLLPRPLAKAGIDVLASKWLRNMANKMSYADPDTFATDDAMQVGRLPVACPRWNDGNLEYMLSGGIGVTKLLPKLADRESLLVWGRQDGIVPPEESAPALQDALPKARLVYVEDCGHVPHLEQPQQLANILAEFDHGTGQ